MNARRRLLVILLWLVLAVVVVYLLFTIIFPWFDRTFLADPVMGMIP